MKPGEQKTVQVRLADYMEYIPVNAVYTMVNKNSFGVDYQYSSSTYVDPESHMNEQTDRVDSVLRELFKMKVPDGLMATMQIYRNPDNDRQPVWYYADADWSNVPGYGYYMFAAGSYYDGAYYIYYYDTLRRLQPGADIPGLEPAADGSLPYKIYRIPVKEVYDENNKSYSYELEADKITSSAGFAEGFRVFTYSEISDGSRAIVLGAAEGSLKAVIVDFAAGGKLTTLDICEEKENATSYDYGILFKDDYAVIDFPGKGYYVVHPQNGVYRVFFAPTDGTKEAAELKRFDPSGYRYMCDAVFADGRLAVAGFAGEQIENVVNGQTYYGTRGTGISLAVYSEKGLEYYTRYESSLFEASHGLINNLTNNVKIRMQ